MSTPRMFTKNQKQNEMTHSSPFYLKPPELIHVKALESFFLQALKDNFFYFPQEAHEYYSSPWKENELRKRLENPRGLLICAWSDEKIVGLVSGTVPEGGVGTLIWLTIAPAYQNQGIGAELLFDAIEYYKQSGAHKIKLTVHDERAAHFYLRNGFIKEAFHPQHWWNMDFWSLSLIFPAPKAEGNMT